MAIKRRLSKKELPDTLYKYRDWNNKFHKRILTKQEIYFPKPSEFNDPFDGNIPVRWDLMTYQDCYKMNLDMINTVHKDKDQKKVRAYAKKVTDEGNLWHPDKMKKESPEKIKEWGDKIGLLSLSEVPDNILMWSHYSLNHSGFVVGFDTQSLSSEYDFDYLEPINYQLDYPLIQGTEGTTSQFHKKFFYKPELWEYEKEWRISKNHIPKRLIKLNPTSINKIILGCCISSKNEAQILKICSRRLTHVEIYRAVMKEEEFALDIKRII